MSVLIVEDDLSISRLVRRFLLEQGLESVAAATLQGARAATADHDFDIVLLDLRLPDGSGLELLAELRRARSKAHVIITSGAGSEDDRVLALGAGADDYVVKPYSVRELVARVLAVRRRLDPATDAILEIGPLVIDLQGRRLRLADAPVDLTSKEFDLLAYLAARPGCVFSREDLLRRVWHSAPEWQQIATVTEHVRRLRTKIEADPRHPTLLTTVRGVGYRFDCPAPPPPVDGVRADTPASVGVVTHIDGRILSADGPAAALLGTVSEHLVGKQIFDFVAPGSRPAAHERMRRRRAGQPLRSQLMDILRVDGTEITVEVTSSTIQLEGGPAGRVELSSVIEPSSRLRQVATGIVSELSDAVIIVDLHSHIRSWNLAAQRLYGWAEADVLGRHLLDVVPVESDVVAARRELDTTGSWHGEVTQLTRDGSSVRVRASTTVLREEGGEPVGVISVNRPAEPTPTVDGVADAAWAAELRRAIRGGELEVHYQPVVRLGDGEVTTVEALVRWNHPEQGLLLPAAFVGVAVRAGLIIELGALVLHDACRQAAAWQAAGFDIDVAVNLSSVELADPQLVERVTRTLRDAGLPASSLWLEVTETGLVEDVGQAQSLLDGLAALGVGISIDDFGTGWASLTYLREFPVQALKIDRSFVAAVGLNPNDTAIVRSILSLGVELDLFVVAEGIETPAQLAVLRELGCRFGQGFLFGRAAPAHEVRTDRMRRLVAVTGGSAADPA